MRVKTQHKGCETLSKESITLEGHHRDFQTQHTGREKLSKGKHAGTLPQDSSNRTSSQVPAASRVLARRFYRLCLVGVFQHAFPYAVPATGTQIRVKFCDCTARRPSTTTLPSYQAGFDGDIDNFPRRWREGNACCADGDPVLRTRLPPSHNLLVRSIDNTRVQKKPCRPAKTCYCCCGGGDAIYLRAECKSSKRLWMAHIVFERKSIPMVAW